MQELPIHYAEVEAIYNQTIGSGYKSLAITSAKAGEGKTTIAQALVERAQIVGKNVLLVDMNTFNPDLSEKLRSSINYSTKENDIVPLEDKGYSFLSAPKNIANILQYRESEILHKALSRWLINFDCIIFDTSPLASLNQNNIPAEIISEVCEGTIMVIEAGQTPSNIIQESIEKLKLKRVNLIGSVLNDKTNPSLLTELIRETYRLNKLLPNLMIKLRQRLQKITLLNVSV